MRTAKHTDCTSEGHLSSQARYVQPTDSCIWKNRQMLCQFTVLHILYFTVLELLQTIGDIY